MIPARVVQRVEGRSLPYDYFWTVCPRCGGRREALIETDGRGRLREILQECPHCVTHGRHSFRRR